MAVGLQKATVLSSAAEESNDSILFSAVTVSTVLEASADPNMSEAWAEVEAIMFCKSYIRDSVNRCGVTFLTPGS